MTLSRGAKDVPLTRQSRLAKHTHSSFVLLMMKGTFRTAPDARIVYGESGMYRPSTVGPDGQRDTDARLRVRTKYRAGIISEDLMRMGKATH